jgi:hypothetical protein
MAPSVSIRVVPTALRAEPAHAADLRHIEGPMR